MLNISHSFAKSLITWNKIKRFQETLN